MHEKQHFELMGKRNVSLFRKLGFSWCCLASWEKPPGKDWQGGACSKNMMCKNCDFTQAIEFAFNHRMKYLYRKERERASRRRHKHQG